jgi:hypothetical protein
MNDPLDELLDRRLRDEMPYIDDSGFTARVLQQLPARSVQSARRQRAFVIVAASILAAVIAFFASGEGWFVRQAFAGAASLPLLWLLGIAGFVGLLLTMGALGAALAGSRDLSPNDF